MAALLWCTSGLSSDMQVSQEICHLYQHCVSGNLTYVQQFIATKGSKVNDLGPSVPQVQEVGAVMGPSIFLNRMLGQYSAMHWERKCGTFFKLIMGMDPFSIKVHVDAIYSSSRVQTLHTVNSGA